jgi:integrase
MEVAFRDWQSKSITAITRSMIQKRHQELGKRGENYANLSMRFLRSLFSFIQAHYDDGNGRPVVLDNPVLILTQSRSWFRTERRQTVIKVHQLPDWFRAVKVLHETPGFSAGSDIADYLLLLIFTGLRKQEGLQLCWDDIDLKEKTLQIRDTKNYQPLILPLTDFLYELMVRRQAYAVNRYVFPGKEGKAFLVEPKRGVQKVIDESGVPFTLHDLRRTFITIAESLDIPIYSIKKMVNHKMRNDVTAGYIVTDVERLRDPMQKVSNFLEVAIKGSNALT